MSIVKLLKLIVWQSSNCNYVGSCVNGIHFTKFTILKVLNGILPGSHRPNLAELFDNVEYVSALEMFPRWIPSITR